MTADATGDLVRAMLERRCGGPAPEWVLDRTMRVVATTPRTRTESAGGLSRRPARGTVALAVVLAAVVVLAAAVAVLVVSPALLPPGGGSGSGGVGEAGGAGSAAPGSPTEPVPPGSQVPMPAASFRPTELAVVTRTGNSLRVRSAPTVVDARSDKYEPTLPTGTRLLVVGGPVRADGYDWFEVQVLDDRWPLFGWVASGRDGKAWIRTVTPECPAQLGLDAFAAMKPHDFLACYGAAEVTLTAELIANRAGEADGCPGLGTERDCLAEPAWLFEERVLTYRTPGAGEQEITLSVPPDLAPRLADIPSGATVSLVVAMEHPDAGSCRAVDPVTRADLVPHDQAITACRARFALRDVTRGP